MTPGIKIGPFTLHFYGLIILAGAIAATFLAAREAKRRNIDPEYTWDMLPWLLIGGIIGARVWHILTPPASMVEMGITTGYYLTHPLEALSVWKGGLGIPGAVIGGALALFLYTRKRKMSFLVWADMIAPGLALAQAVGRWGNFVNQEVYGMPTNLPWAIFIDEVHRLPELKDVAYYHPLFLYESLYNLLLMGVLLFIGRKFGQRLANGDLFMMYLVGYPAARFFLEFLGLDISPVAGLNINQIMMAVIALASLAFLILRKRSRPQQG